MAGTNCLQTLVPPTLSVGNSRGHDLGERSGHNGEFSKVKRSRSGRPWKKKERKI